MSKLNYVTKRILVSAVALVSAFVLLLSVACGGGSGGEEEKFSPIKSVYSFGFLDVDGAKVKAMALEYEEDLTGVTVNKNMYKLTVLDRKDYLSIGNGSVGDVTKIYVNSTREISEDGGDGKGHYVIIELFTDYVCGTENDFATSLVVRAQQIQDITLPNGTVIPEGNTYTANVVTSDGVTTLDPNGFELPEAEGWKFFTDENTGNFGKDGPSFEWKNCFNQQDGLYYDENVAYALFLPKNYESAGGKNGNWGMVTLENPAANKGTHPMKSVFQTRSPSVYASDWAQELVRDKYGLDGLIVVVPVVTERVNDNGGTPAEYEAIVHLWDHVIETYGVNTDYIYGSGQSVGGMILVETQRNRDNFFAGIMLYENQWSQNYFMDTLFIRDMVANPTAAATAERHYPRVDDSITWNYYVDTDGNEVTADHDPYNLYYLVSDDNILVFSHENNGMCIDSWNEMHYLYKDTVGSGINRETIDVSEQSIEDQNAELKAFLLGDRPDRNINKITLEGGSGGFSARVLDYGYEWLLSQTRASEVSRAKLDINKPFEYAADQKQTEDRKLHFVDGEGNDLYFLTAVEGSGTQYYNTSWLNMYDVADGIPGWLPEGMSWENTSKITGSKIVGVTKISDTAVAIEYSENMSNLYVSLVGDEIIGLDGNVRTDIKVNVAPYAFFDADGKEITCTIKNVYVNSSATVTANAERGSGSGNYVIVEFSAALSKTPVYVVQRTTLHTDKYIASALPWKYEFN